METIYERIMNEQDFNDCVRLSEIEFEKWKSICGNGTAHAVEEWTFYRPKFSADEYDVGVVMAIIHRNYRALPFLLAHANTDEYTMYRRLGALAEVEDNSTVAALICNAHVKDSVFCGLSNDDDFSSWYIHDPIHEHNYQTMPTEDMKQYIARRGYILDAWDLFMDNDCIECVKWWKEALVTCCAATCDSYCRERQRKLSINVRACRFNWRVIFLRSMNKTSWNGGESKIEVHSLSQLNQKDREFCLSCYSDYGSSKYFTPRVLFMLLNSGVSQAVKSRFFAALCREGREMEMLRMLSRHSDISIVKHLAALEEAGDGFFSSGAGRIVRIKKDTHDVVSILRRRICDAKCKAVTAIQKHWLYKPGGPRALKAILRCEDRASKRVKCG